jgi:hypothetical protein
MAFGVGYQVGETLQQLSVRCQFGGSQHIDEFTVRFVHFVHVHHQVIGPGEGGVALLGGGIGHGE